MIPFTEKYKPAKLNEFVGLKTPRALLSAFASDPYPSAWLLVGPAGTGKTQSAFALAQQVGGEVHHLPSQACTVEGLAKVCEKCHYMPWVGRWHTVLIDEADKMSPAARLSLLSRLDGTNAPPDTIFVFTANGLEGLMEASGEPDKRNRFVSRCRVLNYTTPNQEEMVGFLAQVWAKESDQPPPDLEAMARVAAGNVRSALMMIETEVLVPGTFVPPAPRPEPVHVPATCAARPPGVDPARSESSRRAWDTIRANRAKRAANAAA